MDHAQTPCLALDRHDLERHAMLIVAEIDEAALTRRIVWCRLIEHQATVIDDIAYPLFRDAMTPG